MYYLETCEKRLTKSNSTYFACTGNSGTERISFMIWGVPPVTEPNSIIGKVLTSELEKNSFGYSTKWPVARFDTFDCVKAMTPTHPICFIKTQGHLSGADLVNALSETLALVIDKGYHLAPSWINFFGSDTLAKILTAYENVPAATSVHHAWKNGLSTHVCEILLSFKNLLGDPLIENQDAYKTIRPELVMAGILFHDYGKLFEYKNITKDDSSKQVYEITPHCPLLGHIYMGARDLRTLLITFGVAEREIVLAEHCVLAHHGIREYGSPVIPAIFEAYLVHLLDLLSARRCQFAESSHMVKDFYLGTTTVDPNQFI